MPHLHVQEEGNVLVTPPTKLSINLTLEANEVEGSSDVPAYVTIEHISIVPLDAYDLVITLPTEDPQLTLSDNATAHFSNGTIIVFSK